MSGPDPTGWRRLHPVTPLFRSLQLLYGYAIGVLAASLSVGLSLAFIIGFGVLIAGWAVLSYLRFSYRVDEEGLVVKHGVLMRQRRVIPKSRIQNVDLRSGLLQQLFGVATARIETAGGGGSEASLHVVGHEEGVRLRNALVGRFSDFAAAPVAGESEAEARSRLDTSERQVGLLDLVIAGATSNRAGVLVGALLGLDYVFGVVPTDWLLRRVMPPELLAPETAANALVEAAGRDLSAFLVGLAALTIFFGVAGWGLSILMSVVRYFGFTLRRIGGELQVSYGLFTRREKGLRRSRVQNVQIEEPILRRWLGLATVKVQTAGYGPELKADERMEVLAPIAKRREMAAYVQEVFPDLDPSSIDWRPSHPRARRRMFLRRAAVIVLVVAVLSIISLHALLLLLALAPAWLLAHAHYRHLGHARSGSFVLTREGLWTRRSYIVPVRKIQALHFRQTPFQRRLRIGTLTVETAGNPLDWHAPRTIDLGLDYGRELQAKLGTEVTATGLVF
ncbi:MAG: PH domain-containing protein [Gemmatimonadetes bacterium]|uniref:PH domain-containing protein n=1 Tax=Candidatus Kutchimonas denitrificans TaxID=3056748 RepID=A0AAE5CAQ7_9BACT|nr:PH domain-containing protein [Gemmatimonadota bacterium]NIR74822.1 PH domain-containing protein [Candidatus Kutchimonas denitrificans]NIR99933.1 PH domain-containing protein [Gemmatimonadota bacterium]NIT65517.1 PH domain-containing protein [Gemmatimonadota bacterium]NIU52487.1 PH domain-containing protein [Gemmatimonadota bacterium]